MAGRGVVLSNSVDVFEGARAAVLKVDGLFRLDVLVASDTLRLFVRNLCGAPLAFEPSGYPRPVMLQGLDLTELAWRPGHHELRFTLGDAAEGAALADVSLATLRVAGTGRVHITAQGLVRRLEAVQV